MGPSRPFVGGARKGRHMEIWLWIIGIAAVLIVVTMAIDRRRGSTGGSRADDLRGSPGKPPDNYSGNVGGGGFGGDGGGGG